MKMLSIMVFSFLTRHLRLPRVYCLAVAGIVVLECGMGGVRAQTVQMPGQGTFSLSTTVAAPDRGAMSAGGFGNSRMGSTGRGVGSRVSGSGDGASSMSVRSSVIDLDELDRMIRSQASTVSEVPDLQQTDPQLNTRIPAAARGRKARPDYDYLAVLSGHAGYDPGVSGNGASFQSVDREATKFYLAKASLAKQRGHWASVEIYYRLAWGSLSPERRELALKALADARARAGDERILSAADMEAKNQRDSKNAR
jgi:hypothetical protein